MRSALVLIVVAGLLAPATAAAAGRVDRLPAVRGKLWTSGTDLVWESPRHFVRVADARRRVRLKIGIDKTCWVESVSISSLALIACSGYSAEVNDALVLDTRTGTITHEPADRRAADRRLVRGSREPRRAGPAVGTAGAGARSRAVAVLAAHARDGVGPRHAGGFEPRRRQRQLLAALAAVASGALLASPATCV